MTLKERLSIIGQAISGRKPKQPAQPTNKKTVTPAKEKATVGGFFDLFGKGNGLVTETTASDKLIEANSGWVYKNNDVIAKEVSGIEFELFTVKIAGKEVVYTPVLQHPILDLLDRFNEFTDASSGFYLTQSHRKLAGDAFWLLDGKAPKIRAVYLLQPDKVTLRFGKVAGGQRIIDGYDFETKVDKEVIKKEYDADEMIHFKIPNPANPYRGKSAVEAAADAIDTDNYATEANKSLFKRGLINNFILSTEKSMTPEQLAELRAQFDAKYAGVDNANRTMILSGGLKPEGIGMSNKDAEFIAQQTWYRDKIMSIFGNNRAVLGITDDVNRSNAESTILNWKRTTVKAEMKAICDTLNEFLVPKFGDNMLLGFKDPVPEDRKTKVDEVKILVESKVITQNEARDMLGLKPVKEEGADVLNQPTPEPLAPIEVPKSVQNISYKKFLRKSKIYQKAQEKDKIKEVVTPIAEKIVKARMKHEHPVVQAVQSDVREHDHFTNDAVWKFHTQQIRIVISQEEAFQAKVERFIEGFVARAVSQVPDEVADMQKKALVLEADEVQRAVIDFSPILTEVAIMSGQEALKFIGEDNPYIPVDLRTVIAKNVRKFAESMVATDKNKIIDMISQGIADGESVAKIRKRITDEFSQYTKMQAERITRTEVIRASNFGTIDAWAHSELVVGKQWLTAMDDRVDPLCAVMNGKTVIGVSKNFFNRGESLEADGHVAKFDYGSIKVPPLHPNCRCTLLPILK